MKRVYVVRHCEAEGQPPEAPLTSIGIQQALDLSEFFSDSKIDLIVSSPYNRAIQSIQPLAERTGADIEIDNKLKERVLSTEELSDWLEKLEVTFEDLELKFEGGESSQEAMRRGVNVVESVFNSTNENTVVVTHGNLMALLLKHFNENVGFEEWKNLSNPDVYLLEKANGKVTVSNIWK